MESIKTFYAQAIIFLIISTAFYIISIRIAKIKEKRKFQFEDYFRIFLFSFSIFFTTNCLIQSIDTKLLPVFFDLKNYPNLPNYLVFLVTTITAYYLYKTLNNQREANELSSFVLIPSKVYQHSALNFTTYSGAKFTSY